MLVGGRSFTPLQKCILHLQLIGTKKLSELKLSVIVHVYQVIIEYFVIYTCIQLILVKLSIHIYLFLFEILKKFFDQV